MSTLNITQKITHSAGISHPQQQSERGGADTAQLCAEGAEYRGCACWREGSHEAAHECGQVIFLREG